MIDQIFTVLNVFEDLLWGYLGVPLLLLVGSYLTFKSRFFQIRKLPSAIRRFVQLTKVREHNERGIHPLKAFFASVGGCVGVGNIAAICTAIQIGGPGALFWIWVTAIVGMMIKYSEIYLGLLYRVPNDSGGYNGGPMYFLQKVFKGSLVPKFICILLCIYGVEVYQFSVVTDSIVTNLGFNQYAVIAILLALVLFAGSGGVRRVGNISSAIIPFFVVLYICMGVWVLINNLGAIPSVMSQVFSNAFTGTAAIGGFAGSSIMLALSQGVRRGCYTGDLGVGYASVIHSESNVKVPEEQASLAIVDLVLDTFMICTTSVMLILVTDVWHEPISSGMLVQAALAQHFPYMHYFMPFFLFLLGYSTINAYFCVGLKCSDFVSPKYGRKIYYAYAIVSLVLFSFIGVNEAQTIMTIANGLLLVINCYGIFRLRNEISFALDKPQKPAELQPAP
jgi:alanine or glycine:cation symporter, AGCS family